MTEKIQKLTLLKGLPGSGKSFWALEAVRNGNGLVKRINKDDIRAMIDGSKWSREREKSVLQVRDSLVAMFLSLDFDVIVDDTNFEPKHEARMRELIADSGKTIAFEVKEFLTPVAMCVERDSKRQNPVGEAVIRGMWHKYLKPTVPNIPQAPDAIVCDLDGTLALLNGRNPYDASGCENDTVNAPVLDIVRTFAAQGVRILLVSGRSDAFERETRSWLLKNRVLFHSLTMRKDGDNRKDSIIKQEIYDGKIKGQYNVLFVMDDRNQVVEMWRENGLTCFQVGFGNF